MKPLGRRKGKESPAASLRRQVAKLLIPGLIVCASFSQAGQRTLVSFAPPFDPASIHGTDAQVTIVNATTSGVLRVDTGHHDPWPGITLPASGGHWDLSTNAALWVRLKNTGTNAVTICCRVDNPGADGTKHCVTDSLPLDPGQASTLKVALPHETGNTLDGKLFGMRGYPAGPVGPDDLDIRNVTQILLFVAHPTEDHRFEVTDIRAGGDYTPPNAQITDATPYFPFIDTFGQYRHKDWLGKVHSLAELKQRRADEAAELADHPGPADWDQYGGWARGPHLEATGFFRTEKYRNRWWLVDPAGHLFWSHGIDCVGSSDATPIEERETWFADFPGSQADYSEFLGQGFALKGHYARRTVKTFSFGQANSKRKYGGQWRQDTAAVIHQRLRSWGFNTIGNWSAPEVYLRRLTPYTDSIESQGAKSIEGSEGYWGRFPDVFDASFAASLRRSITEKTNSSANDPWCLGYFSDNELSWGDEISLPIGVLQSPADQPAKRELIKDLQAKYTTVEKLDLAWGTSYAAWSDLTASRTPPDRTKARDDLKAFYVKLAEAYFRTVSETIKTVAPHQLYLGCRFAWVCDDAAQAASRYCDVVSYNLYRRNISDFKFPGGDKPLLVGEFHFGALDRGLFHTGLVSVENQDTRAQAYRNYVLGALSHPQVVGTHWFEWQDEPTTGRTYDEENYQIGFVDVADTPYREMVSASRDIGQKLYPVRINRN